MALRKIRTYEDEILRKKSKVVEKFDQRLCQLLDDMKDTMYEANGIGLAAPQVGVLKRAVVIDIGEGAIELVNPEIEQVEGNAVDVEGCLSVPNVWGEVERPQKVIVKAQDRFGNEFRLEAEGLLARAVCHEIDHLDGILFVDKVIRFVSEEEIEQRRARGDKMDLE
ncbi:peptide deformylase [Caldicellulosiruptor kronotskyensis 2002]|uniref:Peptide deformylase n=1 Tax=Caldicellulosiruptor kronotskyensis (strain DSM 18902 / VKM B-2412 / 2002) TaxID=632348 RepID=E4SFI2_CALK2|nr:peptide deformylase [Caldicellulosiruptor kronotskyensis]ADQ46507.1 peptide deformylase [Caldicellulosiruptor kronotskyensis 2002]